VKPKKKVDLQMDKNKHVDFKREDMPVTISTGAPAVATMKKSFAEDESSTSNASLKKGELSFARKQLLKTPMKSALRRTVLVEVRETLKK